jgi:acetyl-CoA carboxylase biotin carboxyl carrier protein
MVGTYYSASAPDLPPFVSPGSVVQPDTIVCIIEAMKVFTDIPAGVSGTIAEALVKNGQAVEFGQPLFRVIPSS